MESGRSNSCKLNCALSIALSRKCPYRMPKLFCSISPGNLTYRDLEEAEKLGEDLARHLVNDGALDIMNEAKKQNESS